MRIAWIAAGAGRLWCGACARDLALVRALTAVGHEVTVIPVYLPLRTEGVDPSAGQPVISGGLGTWLREQMPLYDRLPHWIHRLLAERAVLRAVSAYAGATQPTKLGRLTVSMLEGMHGRQRAGVDELVEHLLTLRPERIHLSNSLLLGYAPTLRERLGVPVDCSLQGEEVFVHDLGSPWSAQAQQLMQLHAGAIARFWSPHPRHAAAMSAWLSVPRDRISIVPPSVELTQPSGVARPPSAIIGHLGVMIWKKGADVLAAAARQLPSPCRLRFAGQEPDRRYARSLRRSCAGLSVEFLGELSPAAKRRFFADCRIVVIGSRHPEERGMVALEALAMGVPVIAPHAGIMPDLVASGALRTYRPSDAKDLARVLATALADPELDAQVLAAPDWIAAHHGPTVAAAAASAALGRN
ncbi:MAG: glycosyltransferase family 4 protein [Planctomycetota bacterium]